MEEKNREGATTPPASAADRRRHLVLTDDMLLALGLQRSIFQRTGCRILFARSGRQLIELANAEAPSMLIINHKLSDMTGEELVRLFRGGLDFRRLPVAMLACGVPKDQVERLRRLGLAALFVDVPTEEQVVSLIERELKLRVRRDPRIPWPHTMYMASGDRWMPGEGIDLAPGGAAFRMDPPPRSGSTVNLRIVGHGLEVVVRGLVLRVTPHVALRFEEMSAEKRAALAGLINTETPPEPEDPERILVISPVFSRLALLLLEEEPSLVELARLVELDPRLSEMVQRAARTMGRGAASLGQSATYLGLQNYTRVVLAAGYWCSLRELGGDAFAGLMRHSLACALAAERVAAFLAPEAQRKVLLAGLLHDVGKALLLRQWGAQLGESTPVEDPLQVEERTAGVDHTATGKLLAARWGLPADVADAIRDHHRPWKQLAVEGGKAPLALIVKIADHVCHKHGLDSSSLVGWRTLEGIEEANVSSAGLRAVVVARDVARDLARLVEALQIPAPVATTPVIEAPKHPGFMPTPMLETAYRRLRDAQACLRHERPAMLAGLLACGLKGRVMQLLGASDGAATAQEILHLLDLVRAIGQERAEAREIEVAGVVRGVALLASSVFEREVTLEVQKVPMAKADVGALARALLEILRNAFLFGGDGPVIVRTRSEAGKVVVEVEDYGPGMDSETRARAGQPFFTSGFVGESAGLGLALVFAEMLGIGGTVELDTVPGRGTRVVVRLQGVE